MMLGMDICRSTFLGVGFTGTVSKCSYHSRGK
jgi:hypothetical protein